MSKSQLIHHGLRFSCRRCGRCCKATDSIILCSLEEYKTIARHLNITLRDFLNSYTEKVDGFISILSRPDGACVFYQDGCLIYPVRPIQCRTFPFWSDIIKSPHRWNKQARICHGMNKGKVWDEDAVREELCLYSMNLLKIISEKN